MNHPLEYEMVAKDRINKLVAEGIQSQQVQRDFPKGDGIRTRLVRWMLRVWGAGEVKVVDLPDHRSIASLESWEVRR